MHQDYYVSLELNLKQPDEKNNILKCKEYRYTSSVCAICINARNYFVSRFCEPYYLNNLNNNK